MLLSEGLTLFAGHLSIIFHIGFSRNKDHVGLCIADFTNLVDPTLNMGIAGGICD